MADNKSGPPWLLAVYTTALLLLVLGSLARLGEAPAGEAATRRKPPRPVAAAGLQPVSPLLAQAPRAAGGEVRASDGFTAEVVNAGSAAGRSPQDLKARSDADRAATRAALPWVTEGAFVLLVGVTLGFLTRKEIIAMAGVMAVMAVAVGGLEYFGQTRIPWSSLTGYFHDFVYAETTGQTTSDIVQKGVSLVLGGAGWFMGTKG